MKPVEYDRTIYKKDVQAVISNTYQHLIYNSLYKMLIGISNEVTVDTILSTENKNILNKYIAYSISHIQGKMNCKFN
jgi:hypothetical protein